MSVSRQIYFSFFRIISSFTKHPTSLPSINLPLKSRHVQFGIHLRFSHLAHPSKVEALTVSWSQHWFPIRLASRLWKREEIDPHRQESQEQLDQISQHCSIRIRRHFHLSTLNLLQETYHFWERVFVCTMTISVNDEAMYVENVLKLANGSRRT